MTRKSQPCNNPEEEISRQREEVVQSPEMGLGLVCSRKAKEVSVTEASQTGA